MTYCNHTVLDRATKSGIVVPSHETVGDLWKQGIKAAIVECGDITMIGIPRPDQSPPGFMTVHLFFGPEFECSTEADWDGMRYVGGV